MTLKYHWVDPELIGKSRLDYDFYKKDTVDAIRHIYKMKEKIKVIALNKLIDGNYKITYGIGQPGEFIDFGPLMIRAVDIQYPWVLLHNSVRVHSEIEKPYARARVQPKDILLSIAGTLGQVGLVTWLYEIANINRNVARIRLKKEEDIYYLIAFFGTRYGQKLLEREAVGSVQRHLNLEDLPDIEVALPRDLNLQHAIGNKVRKAERLRELAFKLKEDLNKELLSIGFENVTVPRRGVTWKKPEEIFDRINSIYWQNWYQEVSKRIYADSWVKLSSIVEFKTGCKPHLKYNNREVYYVDLSTINNDMVIIGEPQIAQLLPSRAHYQLENEDIVLTSVGGWDSTNSLSHNAFICFEMPGILIGSSGFSVIKNKSFLPTGYIYAILNSEWFTAYKFQQLRGTTLPTVSKEDLGNANIPVISEKQMLDIDSKVRKYVDYIHRSPILIISAKSDVEALIEGTLDEAKLLAESAEIEQWLKENPSPYATA